MNIRDGLKKAKRVVVKVGTSTITLPSGETNLTRMEELVREAGGEICGRMAILAEGDAQERKDLIYLEKLPLFNAAGEAI